MKLSGEMAIYVKKKQKYIDRKIENSLYSIIIYGKMIHDPFCVFGFLNEGGEENAGGRAGARLASMEN